MSDAPKRPQQQDQQQAALREESALPVAATGPDVREAVTQMGVADLKHRTALRVVTGTIVIAVVTSGVLEYAGWQIAFSSLPAPRTSIPPLAFLRGVWDTTGAASFLGFLSFVTFGFFR